MIIFWIKSNIFSDCCLKTLNRFVATAYQVSRRNFENLLGKVFDCFVVFGSRTEISVFSDFWTNHFGNVVKRPSPVQRKRSGKNVFFPKKVYSVFQLQTLSGNLWLFGRKLPHGCQISIIYVWRIIWRKSHIRKTVSFWSISVNKCSEGMNNLHPQVQKKIRGEIMISWNFIFFWSHQKSHDRNLDFWWEFSARLSKPHSQVYRKSLRKNLFFEETLFS